MSKKILTVLLLAAMMCMAALATQVLATEFRFEVQSRENFAGNDSVGKGTVHTLNGSEKDCNPGFGVTFTESNDGKVAVTFVKAADANIPAGSVPKVNAKDDASLQALRLYFPAGALGNIAGVGLLKNEVFEVKKGVTDNGYTEKYFDSILIAGAGFALNHVQILNIDWTVFEAALNKLIAENKNFFLLGHYSLGYGAGGAKSIQIARLNLVYGGEERVHFAFASFDKAIFGPYVNPFKNSTFTFKVYCDDCDHCAGEFKTTFADSGSCGNGFLATVDFYVCDQTGAQKNEGCIATCSCHLDGIEDCHYTICEVSPTLWDDQTGGIGFTVGKGGEVIFDQDTTDTYSVPIFDEEGEICGYDDVAIYINGKTKPSDDPNNFWAAIHFASGNIPGGGSGDTTTLTLGGVLNGNGGNGSQGWGFTYFNASALSLTTPVYCDIVKGGSVVNNCKAILSLEVNSKGALEIVIRFENFIVSGNVHMGFFDNEKDAKACAGGAPGQYPIKNIPIVNNTVTIPYSNFSWFTK